MPKKGQRATHRVRYTWSDGITGIISCLSSSQAALKVEELQRTAAGERCQDQGITLTVTTEEVTP